MSVKVVTKSNFQDEVLNAEKLVLVDFWAPWCGPCNMMSPIVDEVASENLDKFKVCKINIDDEPELAGQYKIMSIPTLAVFKSGKLVHKLVGVQAKEDLLTILK
ncbi:MAG: thioredoxin [Fusobacteriaceae bacterium]|nr:thioredoxin [Fusobacteriaceae bacterium]